MDASGDFFVVFEVFEDDDDDAFVLVDDFDFDFVGVDGGGWVCKMGSFSEMALVVFNLMNGSLILLNGFDILRYLGLIFHFNEL